MADVERYAKELSEISSDIIKFADRLRSSCGGSLVWASEQLCDSYISLFDRFCPFKIGDRVRLTKTPPIDEGSGWWSCRHFLVKGATGTVKERGYSGKKFTFSILIDDQTWFDSLGNEKPIKDGYMFTFSEDYLEMEGGDA